MSQTSPFRLKCASIPYRKGFLELTPGIHDRHINIEAWQIAPEANLENDALWVDDPSLGDSSIIANCEIEMTVDEAQELVDAILEALRSVES